MNSPLVNRKIVSAIASVVLVALAGMGVKVVSDSSSHTKALCAEFTDATGIYVGNAVALLGINIGEVTDIENSGERVIVHFEISNSTDLPEDVAAASYSSSIVTDRRVELTGTYSGGEKFDMNNCIPLERTRTQVGISETFDAVSGVIDRLTGPQGEDAEVLGEVIATLGKDLDGRGPQLKGIVDSLASILKDPYSMDNSNRSLIENTAILSNIAAENWDDISSGLAHLSDGLDLATQHNYIISSGLAELATIIESLLGLLDHGTTAVADIPASAASITTRLEHNLLKNNRSFPGFMLGKLLRSSGETGSSEGQMNGYHERINSYVCPDSLCKEQVSTFISTFLLPAVTL
ncbi:MAG: MlaD family protein [Mycobacteriaceae bacterium]